MLKKIFFLFFLGPVFVFCAEILCINDTECDLKVVIVDAQQKKVAEKVVKGGEKARWSEYSSDNDFKDARSTNGRPTYSQTPYQVIWLNLDGSEYSICNNIPSTAEVTASSGNGVKMCPAQEE